jgi:hypothetical protein
MTTIGHHLRQALRSWRSTPGLAIIAILTIALGIGVNATVLGLVEALVLRPLPAVSDAVRIVTTPRNPFSYPSYRVFASRQRMFERMAVWQQLSLNLLADGRAERARGLVVSGSYFETLGVGASKGRVLMAADDELSCIWARRGARRPTEGAALTRERQETGDPANASFYARLRPDHRDGDDALAVPGPALPPVRSPYDRAAPVAFDHRWRCVGVRSDSDPKPLTPSHSGATLVASWNAVRALNRPAGPTGGRR